MLSRFWKTIAKRKHCRKLREARSKILLLSGNDWDKRGKNVTIGK